MILGRTTLSVLICSALTACNGDTNSNTVPSASSTSSAQAQTTVKVFDSISNCSTKADVPNCNFSNGIYVIKLGNTINDAQQQRVVNQANNMMQWAHQDVRDQFAAKRIVIGVIENEQSLNGPLGEFVLELNNKKGTIIDGIELIYTNQGKDETQYPTTYQKLMQLYDYYIDQNTNSAPGSELNQAYDQFKLALTTMKPIAQANNQEYLTYDECNYGNQQLDNNRALGTPNPCTENGSTINDDGDDISNGKPDSVHTLATNLNPGALLGTVYEYKVDSARNTPAGELRGSNGSSFSDTGALGSLTQNQMVSWENPAFKPLDSYLTKWFFANKS
ncbi:histidine ammonia-lyase [Vibrio sp. Of7-15]|uniref:histidine ammonia-lyase n=1 Tax=Vibrio sp. Of7-15 TaxID=2724879 RepID=UPI001EF2A569|nr:histidine ammonia-lyase [Vibrio sp. Of7-15]MCG7498273.1 histidine ammonia-lyase [Vibrio sp. Of7-15]